ncbi:MAG: DUF2018 family protein [Sulfurospirillum sp.]|nr:DUF2018 family protein [Sulfurospirillum sp.]
MLHVDEDDFLVGSPRSKFFDIVFYANKSIVTNVLENHIRRHVAMEYLLERLAKKEGLDLEYELQNILIEQEDDILLRETDFYIVTTGEVLTQNE